MFRDVGVAVPVEQTIDLYSTPFLYTIATFDCKCTTISYSEPLLACTLLNNESSKNRLIKNINIVIILNLKLKIFNMLFYLHFLYFIKFISFIYIAINMKPNIYNKQYHKDK